MVNLTIYIEGGRPENLSDPAALTVDSNYLFREGFHKLFVQKFLETDFNLVIETIGSVNGAKRKLAEINRKNENAALLLDLDAPKSQKAQRLAENYAPENTEKLFFMIQEMEAWIVSQPDKIEIFAQEQGLKRKKPEEELGNSSLLKNLHPEEISKPAGKLNTLFRQYFSVEKERKGKRKAKPKTYSKTKDGPKLIALSDAQKLAETFEDCQALFDFLNLDK